MKDEIFWENQIFRGDYKKTINRWGLPKRGKGGGGLGHFEDLRGWRGGKEHVKKEEGGIFVGRGVNIRMHTMLDFLVMAILSGVYFFFEKKTNITVYVNYYFSDINVTILMNFTFFMN